MSVRRGEVLLALAFTLGLAACTEPISRNADFAAPSFIPGNDVDEALRYSQRIKKMTPAELTKEYEQASQAFSRSKGDLSRVRLALLLSLPNTSFSDEGMALNLLKEWLKESKPPYTGLRAFGFFLSGTLEEKREADKRADMLQKKLDALKSMEKNLMQREKP